jgi:DNA polymerase-3 subunit beta
MKIQILQENLSKAISSANKFASAKAQLPVLGNILLKTSKNKLFISSTNLEISYSTSIGAQIEEEGEITVPAKQITEIISNLKTGSLSLKVDKEQLKIESQGSKLNVLGMNASDFPTVPSKLDEKTANVLPKGDLQEALSQVLFASSVDETRPILTGVLFIFKKTETVIVATDGFRLSQKKIKASGIENVSKLVMPKNVLIELSKYSSESEGLFFNYKEKDNQISFGLDGTVLSSRIIEGEYPDFERIMPKESTIFVELDKEELLRAVKLASVFARDSANIVKFIVKKDKVTISAESSLAGDQKTDVDAKVEGDEIEIAFNYRFVEDFLHCVKGESVKVALSNPNAPGVFTDMSDSSFIHLIMPVRVQS